MAPAIPAAATAVGGLIGSQMGAYGQERSSDEASKRSLEASKAQIASNEKINEANLGFGREGLANTKEQQAADRAAYEAALKRGGEEMTAGEGAFIEGANTPNAELATQEEDIAAGNARELQQGASQMRANLAAQGVRGGQSATLLNRGTGDMATNAQTDINKMKYEDEAQRQADLRAYQAAKARAGQTATLAGVAK